MLCCTTTNRAIPVNFSKDCRLKNDPSFEKYLNKYLVISILACSFFNSLYGFGNPDVFETGAIFNNRHGVWNDDALETSAVKKRIISNGCYRIGNSYALEAKTQES